MSEPTREEMLEWLDGQAEGTEQRFGDLLKTHDDLHPEKKKLDDAVIRMLQYDLLMIRAIRRLIETRPRVTRESLETCVNRLSYWSKNEKGMSEKFVRNRILDLLLEASIEIEGEKEA